MSGASTSADTGLQCLAMMLGYFQRPRETDQIRHELGISDAFTAADIVRAARRLDLRAKVAATRWERLDRTALPAIAETHDGGFLILGAIGPDVALVHDPKAPAPRKLNRTEFEALWSGRLILLASRDSLVGGERRFDLTWFVPAIVRYRRLFGEVLAASFFMQVMALVSPLFFQVVIDKVLVHRGLSSLDVLVLGLAVVSLFEVVLGGLRTFILSHTTSRIDVELGSRLFGHLMGLPLAYFGARPAGTTVARVRELENVRAFLTGSALSVSVDVFFTFVFFAVMFLYSPVLTWIVLATVPVYVAISVLVTPVLRRRLDEKFQTGAENQAFLVESVTAVETLKAMAVEPQMQRRWEGLLSSYIRASFRVVSLGNIASQAVQFVSKATTVGTLWFGARLVMGGELTIGELVAFNMLAGRVAAPILRLAQLWQDVQQVRVSVERLGDVLNTPTERRASTRPPLPVLKGGVTFEAVTFRYAPDRPEVLRRIAVQVAPGEVVGIVGASGSGKSTLAKLIQRLYVPESGRVLVDGVDLAMVDTAWLRRQVGVVLQENVLFSRSIRDNIALADPGLPVERVIAAAQLAGAHDFVMELPETYDTVVGERGGTLSGGQRQRVAIARALVTNPRILILDEATSALDYESERLIQTNMRAMCAGRTVFIIAHRLTAVRRCDRILVLDKGMLVEDGPHDALLASGGRYARLWRAQEEGLGV